MAASEKQLNEWFGRPGSFAPVQVQSRLPWQPRTTDGRVQVVLAHPLVADEFVAGCHAAAKACPSWVPRRIDSYVPRPIRYAWGKTKSGAEIPPPKGWRLGDPKTSRHAWAVAFDFFATPADVYPPGGVWTPTDAMPEAFAGAFEARGWTWGKRWQRVDTPHNELSFDPSKLGTNAKLLETGYVDWLTDMLKLGDIGPEVLELKLCLALLRLPTPLGPESGMVFDPETEHAVRQVQSVMGLKVDGVVGPQTEQAIVDAWADQMRSAEAVVVRVYETLLGRSPEASEVSYWADVVRSRQWHALQLASTIWDTQEAKDRRGVPSAPAVVTTPPAPPAPPPAAPVVSSPLSTALDQLAVLIEQVAATMKEIRDEA